MEIEIRRGDITKDALDCDAIVNAANPSLLGGGGVDGSIHRAAGYMLKLYCTTDFDQVEPGVRCRTGETVVTPAFKIPVKAIIHTVGPIFPDGREPKMPGESVSESPEALLETCLMNVMQTAENEGFKSIALPAISCGVYGGTIPQFARIAAEVLNMGWNLDRVVVILFEESEYKDFLNTFILYE